MQKVIFAVVVACAALVATFSLTSSAQAYPDVQISLTSDHQVVYAGDSFTATAVANVECDWDLQWNDISRAADGTGFEAEFTAPDVDEVTKIPLSGRCAYTNPASGRAGAALATRASVASSTWKRDLTITVLPREANTSGPSENGASLANTGGPDRAVLVGGVVLLLAGASVAMVARRRAERAEYDLPTP